MERLMTKCSLKTINFSPNQHHLKSNGSIIIGSWTPGRLTQHRVMFIVSINRHDSTSNYVRDRWWFYSVRIMRICSLFFSKGSCLPRDDHNENHISGCPPKLILYVIKLHENYLFDRTKVFFIFFFTSNLFNRKSM